MTIELLAGVVTIVSGVIAVAGSVVDIVQRKRTGKAIGSAESEDSAEKSSDAG